jgi:phage tail sheath protein FI
MPEFLPPGVCVQEIETGPNPIEGVPTSTAAFLGETERGSVKPYLVMSYREYLCRFGDVFGPDKFIPYAVNGFFENGGKRLYVCRVVGAAAKTAQAIFGDFVVRAAGPGSWGNRIWAKIEDGTNKNLDGTSIGFRLRLAYWNGDTELFDPFTPEGQLRAPQPTLIEDFDGLMLNEDAAGYAGNRVPFIDVAKCNDNRGPESSTLAQLVREAHVAQAVRPANGSKRLADGADDNHALGPNDYQGVPDGVRTEMQGLTALDIAHDVALVYAPNVSNEIAALLIAHCEDLGTRFAVIDCPQGHLNAAALDPRTDIRTNSSYAAYYCPWIEISGSPAGARNLVPAGGHCLGLYARMDEERGVFQSPAGQALRGALDLEFDIDDVTLEELSSKGVNTIRRFPGRGMVVWGARTLSPEWKYVSVKRLMIFLERSIDEGTQWVVFEPNDERLWARVSDAIRMFLRTQWRSGALIGATEREAFFVTCDRTVMTEDDILNGRLICVIGIAPLRPAEFVILRLSQPTADART